MKKISIIFLLVLSFISIFFVGIFGVHITADNITIHVANIVTRYILLEDEKVYLEYSEVDNAYLINNFDEETETYVNYLNYKANLEFGIFYDVYPDNATSKSVEYGMSDNKYASVTEDNFIKLNDLDSYFIENNIHWILFDLYVNALDGSNVFATIKMIFKVDLE